MIDTETPLETNEDLLAALLGGIVEVLDIPSELADEARGRYLALGNHLNTHGDAAGGAPWDVYPQGSFRLGTVVSPLNGARDYDIDLVCLRRIEKTSTTQERLKHEVGQALEGYVVEANDVTMKEGNRCWTLDFPGHHFHADVLPAIPDAEGSPTGILLTDRQVFIWLPSDPIRYAEWFRDRMKVELIQKRAILAERRQSSIEDVPESAVKTTLQRSVQVLKRHRDIFFQADPPAAPPSILITTLAAHAYPGERNLYQVVSTMADGMPGYIQRDGSTWYVANPVQPNENFADKWPYEPQRRENLLRWIEALRRDLEDARNVEGIPLVAERLGRSFGVDAVRKSAERLGDIYLGKRQAGALTMATGTGTISTSTSGTRPVPRHGFYGAEDPNS
jgi:hypothetical protein